MHNELRRAARRATKNAIAVKERLEGMALDDDPDVADYVQRIAATLDHDWATLVLLSLWDSLRGEDQPDRPAVKRALGVLLDGGVGQGSSRAIDRLASLIHLCQRDYESELEELAASWDAHSQQGLIFGIFGADLPTTKDSKALVAGLAESVTGVARVLLEHGRPSDFFPESKFPHLSRLPGADELPGLWRGLYVRLGIMQRLALPWDGTQIMPVSKGFATQLGDELGHFISFTPDDVDTHIASHRRDIAASPFVKSRCHYWTSAFLLMDSLAPWLLEQVQGTSFREHVISQAFEDKVVTLLRDYGFTAGSVNDKGTWITQDGPMSLGVTQLPPGQIDVLATGSRGILMAECKSIYSLGIPQNIVKKLSPEDVSGWRTKLAEKREWAERALNDEVQLAVVVVEGVSEYLSMSELGEDVPIFTFPTFADHIVPLYVVDGEPL